MPSKMASDSIEKYCLICSKLTKTKQNEVTKLDALFLLQFLLEVSPNNQLINSIKSSINLVQLCDSCLSAVRNCKQIYTEISEKVEKFWDAQNKLLDHFNTNSEFPQITKDETSTWAVQCTKYVQNHDFSGFGYPFVIQGLETLLTFSQCPSLPQNLPPGITCTIESESSSSNFSNTLNEHSQNLKSKPVPSVTCTLTDETSSIQSLNDIDTSQNKNKSLETNEILYPCPKNVTISIVKDGKNDNCEDYETLQNLSSEEFSGEDDSEQEDSHQPKYIRIIIAPSGESSNSTQKHNQMSNSNEKFQMEYNFNQDPITRKYLCLEPSCFKFSVSKQYITNHYERDHLKIKEKESFPCEWTGCGKIIGNKQTWNEHMDKHRGTPSNECAICGEKFYYRKRLANHKKKEHRNEIIKCGAERNETKLTKQHERQVEARELVIPKRKRVHVQEFLVDPEVYKCEVPECKGRRFKDALRLQAHMDQHNGTPREICEKCGHRFYYQFHLDEHQQQCRSVK